MNKTLHKIYIGLFFAIGISVTILLAIYGFDYYTTPLEERFFNPDHNALKPSGVIGHGLGILGTLMMIVGVSTYIIRKRYRKFFNIGYLKHWLEFHIFLCSVGPILVLYHTSFKFGGIVSVSFWSMVLVVLSGVIGRFIYVQIPRTIQGQELSMSELNSIKEKLELRIRTVLSEDVSTLAEFEKISSADRYKTFQLSTAVGFIIRDYFNIRRVMRLIKQRIKLLGFSKNERQELITAAKSEIVIARRIALLKNIPKIVSLVAYFPFAICHLQ